MSVPPTGGWPQQSGPGYGGPGVPYGGPPPGYPGYPSPEPPSKGNGLKWVLGGLAVLLVIGLAVTTTLLLTRGDKSSATGSTGAPSDVASAGDTGPVSIITVEPTCTAYYSINNAAATLESSNHWGDERDSLGPAAQWTTDQRTRVQTVADGLKNTADQLVPLAKQTPHRVVRELYEQIIAYIRAYVANVPTYAIRDNWLAYGFVSAGNAMLALCNAISYGSGVRAVVDPPAAPTAPAAVGDVANPQQFVTKSDDTCQAWIPREDKFVSDTEAWSKFDTGIPSANWSPEQRAANDVVFPVISTYADAVEKAGRSSGNPVIEDFAVTSAIYMRAFVEVGTNFAPEDVWLYITGIRLANVISAGCQFVGSK